MTIFDHVKQAFHLSKGYIERATGYKEGTIPTEEELNSLCVLFGIPKEDLFKEYDPLKNDEIQTQYLKKSKRKKLAADRNSTSKEHSSR